MRGVLLMMLLLFTCNVLAEDNSCSGWNSLSRPLCQHFHRLWTEGSNDIYFSGYAWHNRYTYSPARVGTYNEQAWGGGVGKSYYDDRGNWHGLYAIAFLDSHKNLEPGIGYAYLKVANITADANIAAGPALFITRRPDIFNGIPFPGVLPWASCTYKRATIAATYIPGAKGAGNVLFILGKWRL